MGDTKCIAIPVQRYGIPEPLLVIVHYLDECES